MKSRAYIANILRLLILLFLQGLVFKTVQLSWGSFNYIHIIIYPLFIMLAPMNMNKTLLIFLSFMLGMGVDLFYGSIGIHASACVFTSFLRPFILKFLEPYEGYNVDISPSMFHLGFAWFLSYSGILLFAHLFFYFSVEAFSFVFFINILLKSFFSFLITAILVLLHQVIFKTKI